MFNVDGSGLVTTLVGLDFESIKSYLLVVTITDGGSPQFSTNATVSVQVTGTNEFAPVFSNSAYAVSHSEVSYSVSPPHPCSKGKHIVIIYEGLSNAEDSFD